MFNKTEHDELDQHISNLSLSMFFLGIISGVMLSTIVVLSRC